MTKEDCSGFDKLEKFCDTFNLTNFIKSETCYTNNHKLTIDLYFTKKPLSFQGTSNNETELSDSRKFMSTFMRCFVSCLNQKLHLFEIITSLMRQSSYLV